MSKVVVVRYSDQGKTGRPDQTTYEMLLRQGLTLLTGADSSAQALSQLFPDGKVGMKTNCLARKANSTPVAMASALAQLLTQRGCKENDIIIWDRTNRELSEAGFTLNASSYGVRCFGTDAQGVGYSRDFYTAGSVSSLVSRIMTRLVDHHVNLPLLKDHSIAGLSAGLKNMFGAINNPNKFHDNHCDPFAADVSCLEPIRNKHRLTVMDATLLQYQGGPGYQGQYIHPYQGVIVSDDVVAADRVGLEILEAVRKANHMPPLAEAGRPVTYLQTAAERGLGVAAIDKIDVQVIEVDDSGGVRKGRLL